MIYKKSQSAIEFIIVVGFVIFIFFAILLIENESITSKNKDKDNAIIKNIVMNVQDEIMLASKSNDGYQRKFIVPVDLNGKRYLINISDGLIYARTTDLRTTMAIPIINISGDVKEGINTIKKIGGRIYLNS
jgi:hypothetical protein